MKATARQLFISGLILWWFIMAIGYLLKGEGPLFDVYSFVLCSGLAGMLMLALLTGASSLFIQFAYLTVSLGISALPRLAEYVWFPDLCTLPFSKSAYHKEIILGAPEINMSLLFILLGTGLIMGGYTIGNNLFDRSVLARHTRSFRKTELSSRSLVFLFFVSAVIGSLLTYGLNFTVFSSEKSAWRSLIMLANVLLSIDVAAFFAWGFLIYKDQRSKMERFYLWLVPILYGLFMTAGASKGAIFRIVFFALCLLLCKSANFRLRLFHFAWAIPLLAAVSVPLYYVGALYRLQQIKGTEISVEDTIKTVSYGGVDDLTIPQLIAPILDRLGDIDYPVSVIALPEDTENSKYMTLSYNIKSFLNMMVPGTIFPEAKLSTARTMPIIFRSIDEAHQMDNEFYNNETWTAWGIAHANFGWGGGLLFLLICSIAIHFLFRMLETFSLPPSTSFVLRAWYLFVIPRASFYYNMGLDYSFFTGMVAMANLGVVYIVAIVCNRLLNHFARTFGSGVQIRSSSASP